MYIYIYIYEHRCAFKCTPNKHTPIYVLDKSFTCISCWPTSSDASPNSVLPAAGTLNSPAFANVTERIRTYSEMSIFPLVGSVKGDAPLTKSFSDVDAALSVSLFPNELAHASVMRAGV